MPTGKSAKDRYLFPALWLTEINNSPSAATTTRSDRSSPRRPTPRFEARPQLLSTGLYHLGFVNYQLAEEGRAESEYLKDSSSSRNVPRYQEGNYQEQAHEETFSQSGANSTFNSPLTLGGECGLRQIRKRFSDGFYPLLHNVVACAGSFESS